MRALPLLLALSGIVGCGRTPPDLTVPVASGEVRGGEIIDEASLRGGTAADGQVGDFLLVNDRVRFVIQAERTDGHYYESIGGNIIDADIVRPEGQPGRDSVDEWAGMYGLGRLSKATAVEIVDDGTKTGEAIIRVTGVESSLGILTGTLENPDFVPNKNLTFTTDYILRPDTPLLEVRTTITAGDAEVDVAPGDLLQGGIEGLQAWDDGVGLDVPGADSRRFTGYLGRHNEMAMAIVPEPGSTAPSGAGSLLASVADMLVTFQDGEPLAANTSRTYTRYYAVGRDMAAITNEVLKLDGVATREESGVVTAGGQPVAGARVHVMVDGEPFTVAFTDEQGAFSASVPSAGDVTVRASGTLSGVTMDLPAGWSPMGPYASSASQAAALSSLANGAPPIPAAEGYGLADEASPLTLVEPAMLTIKVPDGAPFEVSIFGEAGDQNPAFVGNLGGNKLALAWAHDGEITVPVSPGERRIEVHRGLRFERAQQTVQLEAGQALTVELTLDAAYETPGWLIADPHSHAGPSPDGTITMEARLAVSAASGLDLHFGTDHDHIADYRGLIEPMGLQNHLRSVVADEVSPSLRGHMNVYPVKQVPGASNGGAVRWWETPVETTDELVTQMKGMGDEVFVQANHPLSSGLASSAGWRTGLIGQGDRWTNQIDYIEVNNDGSGEAVTPFFMDLVTRGYPVGATSVSDSHNAQGDGVGLNVSFIKMDSDLASYTDEKLVQALRSKKIIASRGVFLEMSVDPGSMLTEPTDLTVRALSPSYVVVDRLALIKDGVEVESVEGTEATFALRPDADAVYVVLALGSTPIGGAYGSDTPWAMANPIYVDLGGDGWTPPLEPLEIR
ncbi:MAG: CehA/McbA family metallohydrolase [Myxococcota bacterium]